MYKPRWFFLLIVNQTLICVPCRFEYQFISILSSYFCLSIFVCLPNKLFIIMYVCEQKGMVAPSANREHAKKVSTPTGPIFHHRSTIHKTRQCLQEFNDVLNEQSKSSKTGTHQCYARLGCVSRTPVVDQKHTLNAIRMTHCINARTPEQISL